MLHLSPSVVGAALLSAQRAGLRLHERLDRAVAQACQSPDDKNEPATELPWHESAAELFAAVAMQAPDLLTSEWQILYARVCAENDLGIYPRVTLGTIEDGEVPPAPTLDLNRLRRAWPRLVAAGFLQ